MGCASSVRRPSWTRRSTPPGARPRPRSATTVSSASSTSSGRGTSRSSCSRTARHGPLARRARVLDPASPPEGAGGIAGPRLRTCAARMSEAALAFARAIGYRSAGTAEFMLARRRLLLPRAERTDPGRASRYRSGHGDRPRPGADPDRAGRAHRSRCAGARGTRRRGSPLCRGSRDVLSADGEDRASPASGVDPRRRWRRGGR